VEGLDRREAGPELATDQDTIDPSAMDDAALDALIKGDTQDPAPEGDQANADQGEAPETGETQPPKAEQGEEEPWTPPAKEEWEKVTKRQEEQEKFFQRQGTELGDLRKALMERDALIERMVRIQSKPGEPPQDDSTFNERFFENPAEALRQHEEQQVRVNSERILAERNQRMVVERAMRTMVPEIDDADFRKQIAEVALQSGVPKENVEVFLADPFTSDPTSIVALARIVDRNQLAATTRQTTDQVVQKISAATQQRRTISAVPGRDNTAPTSISPTQLASMSDAELDALLNRRA
jgi:hypothetical protein